MLYMESFHMTEKDLAFNKVLLFKILHMWYVCILCCAKELVVVHYSSNSNMNAMLFSFRPIISERNELLVQFLSDLSLTADGFIGHYKFRPKKLPTTPSPTTTTTLPATTGEYEVCP